MASAAALRATVAGEKASSGGAAKSVSTAAAAVGASAGAAVLPASTLSRCEPSEFAVGRCHDVVFVVRFQK